jgi:hypothetical protein
MVNFILFFTYTIMEMETVAVSNLLTVSWTTISFSSSARGQSLQNMAWTGNKKVFCVLEFTKTESTVTVERRFQTIYHTEPPTDKTICEWYMKFQQSGCMRAAKQTGWPGPSAETLKHVPEMSFRCSICHQGWTYQAPVR